MAAQVNKTNKPYKDIVLQVLDHLSKTSKSYDDFLNKKISDVMFDDTVSSEDRKKVADEIDELRKNEKEVRENPANKKPEAPGKVDPLEKPVRGNEKVKPLDDYMHTMDIDPDLVNTDDDGNIIDNDGNILYTIQEQQE